MIWSARSTDWTPPSLGSLSPPESAFGPIVLRRITFLFIATCIHPSIRLPARDWPASPSPRSSRGEGWGEGLSLHERRSRRVPSPEAFGFDLSPQAGRGDQAKMPLRLLEAAFVVLLSEQARAARPLVFGTQHLDRQ